MKTNTFFLCFLLLCASIVFWGCPRKEKTIPIPEEFLRYISFKEGSWWVYRERFSENVDSFWVSKREIGIDLDYSLSTTPEYQDLGMSIKGKRYDGSDTTLYYGCIYSSAFKYNCTHIFREYIYNPYSTSHNRVYYPLSADTLYFVGMDSIIISPVLPVLNVNGKDYENVMVSEHPKSHDNDPIVKNIWARDVGLIYRETRSGEIWELEKYSVQH